MVEGWALLGPDTIEVERRVRTLGVATAVRAYNDAAVPGLGGVWFGKSLVLALAGIELANRRSLWPVAVANAIEALSCWMAIHPLKRQRDVRLRGSLKLAGKEFPSFAQASRPNYYVTQPMRQQTVQPLRALGLAEPTPSDRFNAYRISDAGKRLVEAAFGGYNPFNGSVLGILEQWISGNERNYEGSEQLVKALSPTESLPRDARELLRAQLVGGDSRRARRAAALAWVSDHRAETTDWSTRPSVLTEDHWNDLHGGAVFFTARNAALRVLQEVEIRLADTTTQRMALWEHWQALDDAIAKLRATATAFLEGPPDTSPHRIATRFCRECLEGTQERVLQNLVNRDGRVLRLRGTDIVGGAGRFKPLQRSDASSLSTESQEDEGPAAGNTSRWPSGISGRIPNLHLLAADLEGGLDNLLYAEDGAA